MSDPKDEDYSSLLVEARLAHKAWKARVDGYKYLIQEFENSRGETDQCFDLLSNNPDLLKVFVLDTNVIAQESGILVVAKYLQFGGTIERVEKIKQTQFLRSLCEKGLSSSRAGTKANTVEVILQLIEISGSGDWLFEVISSFYDNRLPKLVAGCVNCTYQMVESFGCTIVPPKIIIPHLSKLFAHADKNVRSETTKLTVELYKWLGEGLKNLLFDDLKQVQQRDLTAEFDKVKNKKPAQVRLTRAQQDTAYLQTQSSTNGESDMDVVQDNQPNPSIDPYELLEPVDVLSKIPSHYHMKLSSAKWQDRKEALEELNEILKSAPRLVNMDYSDLVRSLAKALKDANIQVVQLAASAIENLSKGLREEFRKYQTLVLSQMIERTKEKKPLVSQALFNAMYSIFEFSSLLDILDDALNGVKHKTPQIKISSMSYLLKCLTLTKTVPKPTQVDQIMDVGAKNLSDPQEPVRQAATELIGTLMKIVGDRELKKLLANIDENRLSKVRAVYEQVEVAVTKVKQAATSSQPKKVSSPVISSDTTSSGASFTSKPSLSKAIPTKRLATSPARRDDLSSKAPTKGFTNRTLLQPTSMVEVPKVESTSISSMKRSPESLTEIKLLKKENNLLQTRYEELLSSVSAKEVEIEKLKKDNELLKEKVGRLETDLSNNSTTSRQKDLNVARLTSELDNALAKIKTLEQKLEMAKLQQNTELTPSLLPPIISESNRFSPFRSPDRLFKLRVTLQELSSRVDRLSIEGGVPNACNKEEDAQKSTNYDFPGEEDSWRRAAEVTAELKARIEKMKQRNKMSIRP